MKASDKPEMSFLDHLEELRWHIIRSFVAILVFAILAFIFKGFVFDTLLLGPSRPDFITNQLLCQLGQALNLPVLCINQVQLSFQNINMAGQFTMHLWVAFVAGAVAAFPYIFWEFWRFVKPALHDYEVKHSTWAIVAAGTLFLLGAMFAYYIITPLSIHFLGGYQVSHSVENIINFGSYVSTITAIVLATGIMFELPVFIYFMAKVGLVTSAFLQKYRRHAIVAVLVVAAVITPPDVVSQVLVCIPLLVLYEAGIIIARRVEKKRLYTA